MRRTLTLILLALSLNASAFTLAEVESLVKESLEGETEFFYDNFLILEERRVSRFKRLSGPIEVTEVNHVDNPLLMAFNGLDAIGDVTLAYFMETTTTEFYEVFFTGGDTDCNCNVEVIQYPRLQPYFNLISCTFNQE